MTEVDNRGELEGLFTATIKTLKERIASGEATAADLGVARQLLKDNGIEALATGNNELSKLKASMELDDFDDDEEDKVVSLR